MSNRVLTRLATAAGGAMLLALLGSTWPHPPRPAPARRPVPSRALPPTPPVRPETYDQLRRRLVACYAGRQPRQWGIDIAGVRRELGGPGKRIALTLDACGAGYDAALIHYLVAARIPATVFVSGRWIDRHPAAFRELAAAPLLAIENHGTRHRPLSVVGRAAYRIRGTAGAGEAVDEIEINARRIAALTGRRPRFFRPGTAHCDDVGLAIAGALGQPIAGFNVQGDAGATYSARQVARAIAAAPPGSIVILHMNHPGSGTAAGVRAAVPLVRQRGYAFVRLADLGPAGPAPRSAPAPPRSPSAKGLPGV